MIELVKFNLLISNIMFRACSTVTFLPVLQLLRGNLESNQKKPHILCQVSLNNSALGGSEFGLQDFK